jgi:HNH endonuclease
VTSVPRINLLPVVKNRPLFARLISRTRIDANGCWNWKGPTSGNGVYYGTFTVGSRTDGGRRSMAVHRAAYQLFKGAIPKGMMVCHTCDNPICWNPDHLYAGTHADNMRDRETHGKRCSKLNWSDVVAIRALHGVRRRAEIAEMYGISIHTVDGIIYETTWKTEPPPVRVL